MKTKYDLCVRVFVLLQIKSIANSWTARWPSGNARAYQSWGPRFETDWKLFFSTFVLGKLTLIQFSHAVKGTSRTRRGPTRTFHSMWFFKSLFFPWIGVNKSEISIMFICAHGLSCAEEAEFQGGWGAVNFVCEPSSWYIFNKPLISWFYYKA